LAITNNLFNFTQITIMKNTNTIVLQEEVIVSDPCYTIPTWCQIKLKSVLPGPYKTFVDKSNSFGWGMRCHRLGVVHTDYVGQELSWRIIPGNVGVDSGQAGIFSLEGYRNDELAESITTPDSKFIISRDGEGDAWYEKMCKFTLDEQQWGSYDTGVVSSSGIGDGGYDCLVARHKGKIVGICINYGLDKSPNKFINTLF
jgi:hypothetical protein